MSKTPDLKFKYANGLGDLVACSLHSKALSWLTKLITGEDKPCTKCSMRRHALNILFPIQYWKLFFKDEKEVLENLAAEYRALGYEVSIDEKQNRLDFYKK
jgi:hypothetical protein